jgi:hypothetical protein
MNMNNLMPLARLWCVEFLSVADTLHELQSEREDTQCSRMDKSSPRISDLCDRDFHRAYGGNVHDLLVDAGLCVSRQPIQYQCSACRTTSQVTISHEA